jgi:hypothetical protein
MQLARSASGLSALPQDAWRSFLDYLCLEEIVCLDSAVLDRNLRQTYLSALSRIVLYDSIWLTEDIADWLFIREIFVKDIQLDAIHQQFLETNRHTLESITITGPIRSLRIGTFPRLVNLTVYNLRNVDPEFLLHHPQLERLVICVHLFSTNNIPCITQHCPHLLHLDLSDNKWFKAQDLLLLAQGCPKLTSLDLSRTRIRKGQGDEAMRMFLSSHPQLESISYDPSSFNSETVTTILRSISLKSLMSDDPNRQLIEVNEMIRTFSGLSLSLFLSPSLSLSVSLWPFGTASSIPQY